MQILVAYSSTLYCKQPLKLVPAIRRPNSIQVRNIIVFGAKI